MPVEFGSAAASLNTYRARVEEPGSGVLTKTVEAAYFATEDGLIEFKDNSHKVVYAVRHDCLLSVERVQLTSEGSTGK